MPLWQSLPSRPAPWVRVTGATGPSVPSGPHTDHGRNTKASSREGYCEGPINKPVKEADYAFTRPYRNQEASGDPQKLGKASTRERNPTPGVQPCSGERRVEAGGRPGLLSPWWVCELQGVAAGDSQGFARQRVPT